MYKGKTMLAIIPARGGSKGIPHKNITYVAGKPLIQYTIEEAKNSKYIDRIIVSTDDMEISKVSEACGAEVPFMRPKELGSDDAKIIDTIIFTLNEMSKKGIQYDYLILLQPTQPLRKSIHIDDAIEKIVGTGAESLVSVSKVEENPLLMRKINNEGELESILNEQSTVRRQDFTTYYKVNGAIYINLLNENFNENTSFNDNKLAFIMDKQFDLDIDEPVDIELFEKHIDNFCV